MANNTTTLSLFTNVLIKELCNREDYEIFFSNWPQHTIQAEHLVWYGYTLN